MSTIARTAAGTPVASNTTGGPPGPAQSRAAAHHLVGGRPPQRLRAERARRPRAGAPAGRSPAPRLRARGRRAHMHWPIGPAPSTTTRSPPSTARAGPPGRRSTPARPSPRRPRVGRIDREHLLLAGDQAAAAARRRRGSRSARSCRRCSAARRCTGSTARTRAAATARPAGRPRARRGSRGPSATIVAATSWPCTRGNCEPPARRTARREEVVVRAADADRLGCDQDLAGTGVRGIGTVDDRDRADPLGDGGSHRPSAPDFRRGLDDQLELGDLLS